MYTALPIAITVMKDQLRYEVVYTDDTHNFSYKDLFDKCCVLMDKYVKYVIDNVMKSYGITVRISREQQFDFTLRLYMVFLKMFDINDNDTNMDEERLNDSTTLKYEIPIYIVTYNGPQDLVCMYIYETTSYDHIKATLSAEDVVVNIIKDVRDFCRRFKDHTKVEVLRKEQLKIMSHTITIISLLHKQRHV